MRSLFRYVKTRVARIYWALALLSGRYKQGKERLHPTEDTDCCLGVACKLYGQKRLVFEHGGYYCYEVGDSVGVKEGAVLPPAVQTWLGYDRPNPEVKQLNTSLAELNDAGTPFWKIALYVLFYNVK